MAIVSHPRAVSSAVEHLVYTERVGGSKPSPPTSLNKKNAGARIATGVFVYFDSYARSAVHRLLQRFAGGELGSFRRRNLDRLARARIAAFACRAFRHRERAETDQAHVFALL